MKVAFLNLRDGKAKNEYPQLGLLYLASVTRSEGHSVDFFDAAAVNYSLKRIISDLNSFKPDVCALSLYTGGLIEQYNFIKKIKRLLPDCIVITGGPHASALPERTMEECKEIDFLIYGEGEKTFIELLTAIKSNDGKVIRKIKGICFRDKANITKTQPRELIDDLDTIPFPAHDLVFEKGYRYCNRRMEIGDKVAAVISSRGCPWNCTFCYKHIFGRKFRRRSPENVVNEIDMLISKYGINDIQFVDDLFACNSRWLLAFCRELERRNINIHWKCLGRVDSLTEGDMEMMKAHGCYGIEFGVESGNNDVLKDINKKITVSQVRKTFVTARRLGLTTSAYFILGNRLDTSKTILETMSLATEVKPDFCGFATLLPFPGTKVFELLNEESKYRWEVFSGYYSYKHPFSLCSVKSEDLQRYGRQARIEYYGRTSYLIHNIILPRHSAVIKKYQLERFLFYFMRNILLKISGKQVFS